MKSCHRCSHPWPVQEQPGFNNTCEGCGTPLHACANCDHYSRESRLRCTEPQAPRILDASAANDCKLFRFRHRGAEPEAGEQIASLRRSFLAEDAAADTAAPLKSWDQLFRD